MKNISTYLLLALLGVSFQACGGGGSSDSSDGGASSLFTNAQKLSLNDAQNNVHLTPTVTSKTYTIDGTSKDHDYYVKLSSPSTNDTSGIHDDLKLETYEGETLTNSYSLAPSYTRIYQIKQTTASDTNFLIKGSETGRDYTYSFTNFVGLQEGLVQDTTTYEPNDFQDIAYKVDNNTLYSSRANPLDDPADWYTIQNAQAGKDYYVEFYPDPSNSTSGYEAKITLQYFDADGNVIAEASDTNEFVTETGYSYNNKIIAPQDGNISVKITPHYFDRLPNDDRVCKYSFKTYKGLSEGLEQNTTTYEPNNYQSLAYSINLDDNISSRVYGKDSLQPDTKDNTHIDKSDWFVVVNIDSSKTYTLSVTADSSNPSGVTEKNLYVDVYDGQGILASQTVYTGNTANIALNPTANGDLYINIRGQYIPDLYKYNFILSQD